MKHVFVINPVAGKEDAGTFMIPRIWEVAQKCGIEPVIETTEAPRHAIEIARKYGESGEAARLYSVGGDGTLNELFNGSYPYPQLEVASCPYGSGNDFIRSFGTLEDFKNLENQIKGRAIAIDLMQVDEGVSAAITSTGLDAEVAYNIPKYRRIPLLGGTMAYNMSILEKLLRPLGKHLKVVIDGETIEGRFLIATVCNGQFYGGGYQAAPEASLEDGLLDVVLVKKVSRFRIASIIGSYKNGNHMKDGKVLSKFDSIMVFKRGREVTITPTGKEEFILNVDGECGPAPRLYAKVMPLAARFVLPKPLAMQWDKNKHRKYDTI